MLLFFIPLCGFVLVVPLKMDHAKGKPITFRCLKNVYAYKCSQRDQASLALAAASGQLCI